MPSQQRPLPAHPKGHARRWLPDWRPWGNALLDLCLPPTCVLCHGLLEDAAEQSAERVVHGPSPFVGQSWKDAWGWGLEMSGEDDRRPLPHHCFCESCLRILAGSTIRRGCDSCGRPLPIVTSAIALPAAAGDQTARRCSKCRQRGNDAPVHWFCPLGKYADVLRESVLASKQRGYAPLALGLGKLLGWKVWGEYQSPRGDDEKIRAVTYIPSSWTRRLQRGGMPTQYLAEEVSRVLRVPLYSLLRLTRRTRKQGMLSDAERRENVRGAFAVRSSSRNPGGRILVVDDVWTTGSTIREAAEVLQREMGLVVCAAVVARAVGAHDR